MADKKEQVVLPVGRYGDKKQPGMEVIRILDPRPTKDPELFQRSLVCKAIPGSPGYKEGTAFLTISLKDWYLNPDVLAFVFEDQRSNGAKPEVGEQLVYKHALDAMVAANTPAENAEEETKTRANNIKTQISINVGTIFRLQEWDEVRRNAAASLADLEGLEFTGDVEHKELGGKIGTEVRVVKKRGKSSAGLPVSPSPEEMD